MKKFIALIACLLAIAPQIFAQGTKEGTVLKLIEWKKIGQIETIKRGEKTQFFYNGINEEETYVKYAESIDGETYSLELAERNIITKEVSVQVPQSVVVPADGSSPVFMADPDKNPARRIAFEKIWQKEKIKTGETVNITYPNAVKVEKVYLAAESDEDGYWLQLSEQKDPIKINFIKRCQTFIALHPRAAYVSVDKLLKYEQVIWTPRADGTWEVRIGTKEQGCVSSALERIKELRTTDYEKTVPIEKKTK